MNFKELGLERPNINRKSWVYAVVIAVLCLLIAAFTQKIYYKKAYPTFYWDTVQKSSEEYNVDMALVYAVIRTESGFNHEAESCIGARGLMQITEDTFNWAQYRKNSAQKLHYDQMFEPNNNIDFGVLILSILLEEFKTEETALAAYHAGWGNVKEWLSNEEYSDDGVNLKYIPFDDTRAYVKKVMETKDIYINLYDM